jgi:hypothetical protein
VRICSRTIRTSGLGRARALSLSPERAREILQGSNLQWSLPACFSAAEANFDAAICRVSLADDARTHKVVQPNQATVLQTCKHVMGLCTPWQACRFFMQAAAEPIDFAWRPPRMSPVAGVICVALRSLADYLAALYVDNGRSRAHGDLDMLFVVNEAIWRLCSGTVPELTSKRASRLGFKGVVLQRALALPSLREWPSYSECLYMVAASLGEDAGLLDKRPTRRAHGIHILAVYSNLSYCAMERAQHENDPNVLIADRAIVSEGEGDLAAPLHHDTRAAQGSDRSATSSGAGAATTIATTGVAVIETGFYSARVEALRRRRFVVKPQHARTSFDITAEDLLQPAPDLGMITASSDALADVLPALAHGDIADTFVRNANENPIGALESLAQTTAAKHSFPLRPCHITVGQQMMCPFSDDDDDDLECLWLIQRNLDITDILLSQYAYRPSIHLDLAAAAIQPPALISSLDTPNFSMLSRFTRTALQDPISDAQDKQISILFGRELEKRERTGANSVASAHSLGRRPVGARNRAETSVDDLSEPLLHTADLP